MSAKAFEVHDELGDAGGTVVFAELAVVARREGADALEADFADVRCRRAPHFDQYAPGPVPRRAFLEAGWYWSCTGCEERVTLDDFPNAIVSDDSTDVYCTADCKAADEARDLERKRKDEEIRVEATAAALKKFPFATVSHVYSNGRSPTVALTFPGGQHPATWEVGASVIYVTPCDRDTWVALHPEPKA